MHGTTAHMACVVDKRRDDFPLGFPSPVPGIYESTSLFFLLAYLGLTLIIIQMSLGTGTLN
jgi:hypothetical protein